MVRANRPFSSPRPSASEMASAAAVTVASTQLLTTSLSSRVAAALAGSVSRPNGARTATASRAAAACSQARCKTGREHQQLPGLGGLESNT